MMQTYLLTSLDTSADDVDAAVRAKISKGDAYQLESGKWLIKSDGITSKEVADGLGISDSAVFFIASVRGYYGRATPDVWEWLSAQSTKANA